MKKYSAYPPSGRAIYYRLEENQAVLHDLLKDVDVSMIRSLHEKIFEKTMIDLQELVKKEELTYEQITAFYLERIQRFDQVEGRTNAYITINSEVLNQAREADKKRQQITELPSLLFGLPIAIKDNVLTKDLTTTVGTYALKEFVPSEDATLIKALKESGAIIIGKTNLSEFANFMGSEMPSGYSSVAGQTLNPYDKKDLTPLGASSGSGVAATLNLAVGTIGTETTGSITAPAAVTSTVGFKPSLHAALDEGIFPLSSTMDCPGPITRSVADAQAIFNIIRKTNCDEQPIKLKRIALSTKPHPLLEKLKQALNNNGYAFMELSFDTDNRSNLPIILADFASDVEKFAEQYGLPLKSLKEFVLFNKEDIKRRALYGQDLVEKASKNTTETKEAAMKQVQEVKQYLESLDFDVFISFNNWDVLLPATAGYPELTIPYGLDQDGVPQGITLIAKEGNDDALLAFGREIEKLFAKRVVLQN